MGSRSPLDGPPVDDLAALLDDRSELDRRRRRIDARCPSPPRTRAGPLPAAPRTVVRFALRDRPVPEIAFGEVRPAGVREQHLQVTRRPARPPVEQDPSTAPLCHRAIIVAKLALPYAPWSSRMPLQDSCRARTGCALPIASRRARPLRLGVHRPAAGSASATRPPACAAG